MSTYKSQVSLELPSEILRKRISSLICALRFRWYAVCCARPPPLAYLVSVVTLVLVSVLPSANVKVVSTFVVVVVVFTPSQFCSQISTFVFTDLPVQFAGSSAEALSVLSINFSSSKQAGSFSSLPSTGAACAGILLAVAGVLVSPLSRHSVAKSMVHM